MTLDLPAYKYFKVSVPSEFVAHVEINRPSKLNAFFEPMWQELRVVFETLGAHPDVRVIVLSGAGDRAFTAGLDLQHAADAPFLKLSTGDDPGRKFRASKKHIEGFQACVTAVEACGKPVACVLHGYAFGLGVDLSCCTDVRFASADVQLCVKEIDLGFAADIGTLTRLPKIVGSHTWVKDVCLTARTWGAEEALRVGFVSGIGPDKRGTLGLALQWAQTVAGKSPMGAQSTKELLDYSREHNTAEALRYTAVWNGTALQTTDVERAMGAARTKKPPRFEKL